MIYRDLQKSFEISALRFVNIDDKPTSSEIEFWLNLGKNKFWKTRYSGINTKREGFEQSQKRIDDLRTLVTIKDYTVNLTNTQPYIDRIVLPSDYAIMLGETAGILPVNAKDDCWDRDPITGELIVKQGDVLEATVENIDRQLQNSLSEHLLHRSTARPLRLIRGNEVQFYTDGKYYLKNYKLTYLRMPKEIDLHTNPGAEYTDMPAHTHEEIVKIAVELFLGNRANPKLETQLYEVSTME